jgi:hypothetical protein
VLRGRKTLRDSPEQEVTLAPTIAARDTDIIAAKAVKARYIALVQDFTDRIGVNMSATISDVRSQLTPQEQAHAQLQQDEKVKVALVNAIREGINCDALQLVMEHCDISIRSWEKMDKIIYDALCAAMGLKPGVCPRILPKAEVLQAKINELNMAMLACNPHHPVRNPGCLLDLHPVLGLICRHTQAATHLLYVCIRVDANLGNLYLSATNHTDHVLSEDNPFPQMCQYQDPNSPNSMDFGVIKPAPHLKKNDDVEDPKVRRTPIPSPCAEC